MGMPIEIAADSRVGWRWAGDGVSVVSRQCPGELAARRLRDADQGPFREEADGAVREEVSVACVRVCMRWLDADELGWHGCHGDDAGRVERLLGYLERFPRGRHNREAAEALEILADRLAGDAQRGLRARLRALRQPQLGPIARETWGGPRAVRPSRPVARPMALVRTAS